MARIIGKDALPLRQQLTLLCAEIVNEAFLRQNAFSEIDRVCSPARQSAMMRVLGRFIDLAENARGRGRPAGATSRGWRACARCSGWARKFATASFRASPPSRPRWSGSSRGSSTPPRAAMRLTVEGAATASTARCSSSGARVDAGLSDAVEVRGADGARAAGPGRGDRPRRHDDRGAGVDVGTLARRHRRALHRRAAVVRAVPGDPGPRVQRRRTGDRRRAAGGGAQERTRSTDCRSIRSRARCRATSSRPASRRST